MRGEDDRILHAVRRPCDRRDTERSEWRGGRAAESTSTRLLGIQAARLRAWRVAGVTIWHVRSKRSEAQRSEAVKRSAVREPRASSSSGTVGRVPATDTKTRDPRPRERAAFVRIAGAAGLAVLR